MLFKDVAFVGEEVYVDYPDYMAKEGTRGLPNKTIVRIVSFGEIVCGNDTATPGIFENRYWVNVQKENDGNKPSPVICISSRYLSHLDFVVAETIHNSLDDSEDTKKLIRTLPDMYAWEGDVVQRNLNGISINYKVHEIDYNNQTYTLEDYSGHRIRHVQDKEFILLQRGNFWNHKNKPEELFFHSIQEECKFYLKIGKIVEQKGLINNSCIFMFSDAMKAFNKGEIDLIRGRSEFFSESYTVEGFICTDPQLKARVRKAMEKMLWGELA